MNIHEYQAKQVLAKYHVPVPRGQAAFTPKEAVAAAQGLGLAIMSQGELVPDGRLAVLAVPDELREEEVLACVVLKAQGRADPAAAVQCAVAMQRALEKDAKRMRHNSIRVDRKSVV